MERIPGLHIVGTAMDSHMNAEVREIMTPGVLTICEDASLRQALRALIAHEVSALLVVGRDEARPIGWVTARGLLSSAEGDVTIARARDAITERPVSIDPNASAHEAVILLSQPATSHLLVRREGDQAPEGVVSEMDVVALGAG